VITGPDEGIVGSQQVFPADEDVQVRGRAHGEVGINILRQGEALQNQKGDVRPVQQAEYFRGRGGAGHVPGDLEVESFPEGVINIPPGQIFASRFLKGVEKHPGDAVSVEAGQEFRGRENLPEVGRRLMVHQGKEEPFNGSFSAVVYSLHLPAPCCWWIMITGAREKANRS